MYQGRTVFSQVLDFLPMHKFRRCVSRYYGNKGVRTFTCFDQFMCIANNTADVSIAKRNDFLSRHRTVEYTL